MTDSWDKRTIRIVAVVLLLILGAVALFIPGIPGIAIIIAALVLLFGRAVVKKAIAKWKRRAKAWV